jgi:hypothetical protein
MYNKIGKVFNMRERIYTGRILQEELLGLPERVDRERRPDRLPFQDAVAYAKQIQKIDPDKGISPACPAAYFANDLHAAIAEKLGLDDYDELKYYTALYTSLDWDHGIDAFFESGARRVTFGVTLDPHRTESKADLTFLIDEDDLILEGPERKRYLGLIDRLAQAIADRFE